MQKFAVGHKCPNYLAAGIRSTRRLYGRRHRNLSGRRNLRDGRANERPRHPFSPPSLSEFRIPTHQTIPLLTPLGSCKPPPTPPFVALCRPNQFRSPRFSWAGSWRATVRWKILRVLSKKCLIALTSCHLWWIRIKGINFSGILLRKKYWKPYIFYVSRFLYVIIDKHFRSCAIYLITKRNWLYLDSLLIYFYTE